MFKIGNVEINGKVVCAPMAGVTNRAYRNLVKKYGAALTYTEMTSTVGLKYNSARTLEIADIGEDETPVSLQIFGGSVEDYIAAAKYFDQNSNASIIDINMGCPVEKVAIKSNAGSALVKTPEKIREIIRGIVKVIKKPLTIKIRIGWDENDLTYMQVAKIADEEGASAIAVHGRTRNQMYRGKANWQAIKEIKDSVSIPVIGNGDVKTPEEALQMLKETGVDAVMIARGAWEKPYIFKQVNEFLESKTYSKDWTIEEVCNNLLMYYKDLKEVKGQKIAFKEIRGIAVSWFTPYKAIKQVKNELVRTKTEDEFIEKVEEIKNAH